MSIKNFKFDLWILIIAIIICNFHLLLGASYFQLTFIPKAAINGQWWRFITHAFTHLSIYHFLIDVSAFFLLYFSLRQKSPLIKLIYVAACGTGSLALALLFDNIYRHGLCGLSGVAHGLTAIIAYDLIISKVNSDKYAGVLCLIILLAKTIFELISGKAFFSFLHLGNIGIPIIECHAGGILGGLLIAILGSVVRINLDIFNTVTPNKLGKPVKKLIESASAHDIN